MESDSWLGLGSLIFCLVLLAFITAAEVGLTLISRGRIKVLLEEAEARAKTIDWLLQRPSVLISTILIAKSIATIGFASVATAMVVKFYGSHWGIITASIIASLIILILLQTAIKTFIELMPEKISLAIATSMRLLTLVLTPVVKISYLAVNLLLLITRQRRPAITSEEHMENLRKLFDAKGDNDVIEEEEKQMIRGIFELEETTAREIMVPRIDIVAVDTETSLTQLVDQIVERGYSRIPLYEETIDNIVGVVYAKDLLGHSKRGTQPVNLKEIARPAYFIPESKRIDELLREFQRNKVHIAIAVDEYGGTAGLVTIEDLLEEIVGEIEDEYDREEPQVVKLSDTEAILDARVSINDLNELFDLDIKGEDFETVGGLVFTQLGRIPSVGDNIETSALKISVLSTTGRRIKKVKVTKTQSQPSVSQKNGKIN